MCARECVVCTRVHVCVCAHMWSCSARFQLAASVFCVWILSHELSDQIVPCVHLSGQRLTGQPGASREPVAKARPGQGFAPPRQGLCCAPHPAPQMSCPADRAWHLQERIFCRALPFARSLLGPQVQVRRSELGLGLHPEHARSFAVPGAPRLPQRAARPAAGLPDWRPRDSAAPAASRVRRAVGRQVRAPVLTHDFARDSRASPSHVFHEDPDRTTFVHPGGGRRAASGGVCLRRCGGSQVGGQPVCRPPATPGAHGRRPVPLGKPRCASPWQPELRHGVASEVASKKGRASRYPSQAVRLP